MMKTFSTRLSLLLLIIFCSAKIAKAQMVGPNAYVDATNLELGIDGAGGFEGCNTGVSPPFPTMNPRSANPLFGFVANPQLDGWATFDGDFFTPGTPENGWGIEITGGANASNNCTGGPEIGIPGTITDWSNISSCYSVDWEGDLTSSGTDLHFKVNYFLQETDLFYTTTVYITNNTGATIPEMYYYRNLDPDNNVEISGDYGTTNTIVSQPGTGCNLAHVSATSVVPASQPQSYLGLAAIGANYRVCYGGFSNRGGSNIWNGIGFTQTVGSVNYADEAISLGYKISNLAPGATEVIKFVVILDDASATQAINNLLYLTYPGSTSTIPPMCTPFVDTIPTCGGAVPIAVTGVTVSDYNWTWSPTAGLSDTTGASTIANPATTTVYTVSGSPISSCVAPTSFTFVVKVTPGGGAPPVITAVPVQCISNPPFTLSVDSTGGIWTGTGITNSTTGLFNPGAAGVGTFLITYTRPGSCAGLDTMYITVNNGPDPTITQPPTICIGTAPFNLSAASGGGTWTGTGITSGSAGTFDPALAGPGSTVITYSISGTCAAVDTITIDVVSVFDPTITPPSPVCQGTSAFNLSAATGGGTWTGTGITSASAGTFNPATAGTFPVIYTIPGSCGSADTVNVTVLSQANATISPVSAICTNSAPFNLSAATTGGTWSGVGITSSSAGTFDPAVSGGGTFTVTYSIGGACGDTATQTVTVNSLPTPSFTAQYNSGCAPLCTDFYESTSTSCASIVYLFGDGDTAFTSVPNHCYTTPGVYTVSLQCTNANGCTATVTFPNLITVDSIPVANFTISPSTTVPPNTVVGFTDITSWGASSYWMFDDPGSGTSNTATGSPASHTYANEGDYCVMLVATNTGGCVDTVRYCIIVEGEATIFIPNVFTPNGDSNNDFWVVSTTNMREVYYDIYDRWGLKVASYNGLTGGWNGHTKNGKMAPDGTYYYVLKATAENGKEFHHEGWIQLLSEK